jgi:hypothetical protein
MLPFKRDLKIPDTIMEENQNGTVNKLEHHEF